VLRTKEKPPPAPMTADEMARLLPPQRPAGEKEGEREDALASLRVEKESAVEIQREMARAAKEAYLRILEGGYAGVSDEELYGELEEEGYPRSVVKLALDRLAKAKRIASSRGVSAVPARTIPGTRRMKIEIEKLVSGHAVAWIDGTWRAKLLPENYEGPRELIKKGSRFEALCSLYDESGVLCVNVRQVVRRA